MVEIDGTDIGWAGQIWAIVHAVRITGVRGEGPAAAMCPLSIDVGMTKPPVLQRMSVVS